MLGPAVRGLGRNAVLQSKCRRLKRHIHVTSVRNADDLDKQLTPNDPENSRPSDSNTSANPQQTADSGQQTAESTSLPERIREATEAEQELPRRQQERESKVEESARDFNGQPGQRRGKVRMSDEEFEARRRERQAKVKKVPSDFNLPTESVAERNAKYRQRIHDLRTLKSDEAALRGEQIFAEVNAKRKERGEPELAFFIEQAAGPGRERRTRDGNSVRGNQRDGLATGDSASKDASSNNSSRRPRNSRGRGKRDEPETIFDLHFGLRLEEKMSKIRKNGAMYNYAPKFDPSDTYAEGFDEVDYELGTELPDAEPAPDEGFTIANRDGTVTPGRKTNRDHDELPEDASIYLDVSDIGGGAGERTFYAPEISKITDLNDQLESLKAKLKSSREEGINLEASLGENFDERVETDVQELLNITNELEDGHIRSARVEFRTRRRIKKMQKELDTLLRERTNSHGWLDLVPLPVPHKPETKNVDDYVAPIFTHESFQYGIPSLPFGSQGRLAAARDVSFDVTEPFIPGDLTPEKIHDLRQALSGEQGKKTMSELTSAMEEFSIGEIDKRPLPAFNKRAKIPNTPKSSERPGEVFDINREVQFEDLYSDTQLAIWKEMNAGSFANPILNFPELGNEDAQLTLEQEAEEDAARERAFQVVEQVDAATLRTFRRRDEFEIRDIRRRLGLPIVGETMNEPYYDRKRLSDTSPIDLVLPGSKKPDVLKGEIVNEKGATKAEIADDTEARLQFWRDSKAHLESLAARIEQLRSVTQSAAERMRRQGTGELVKPLQPGQQPGTVEVVEETAENGLMATLHSQFINVHKKLEKLEALITAAQLGPRGPLDPEYSAAWVESSLHESEKEEFEQTALKMGYPANSVTMEPVFTEEQQSALTKFTNEIMDAASRIGVGGEYREFNAIPGEGLPYPMSLAGRYAAKAGLDSYQRGMRIFGMAQTFEKMGIEFEDPLKRSDEEERNATGEAVGADLEVEDNADGGEMTDMTPEVDQLVGTRPKDPVTANYIKIVHRLRESMKEIDEDVSSLENDYDAFLHKQQVQAPPSSSSQTSSQEASP